MCEEIDKDFYCSAELYDGSNKLTIRDVIKSIETTGVCISVCELCRCYHHKFPTPEQFKKEYGFEYSQDGAVYVLLNTLSGGTWLPSNLKSIKELHRLDIASKTKFLSDKVVCACTPYGKPPTNWRSE
jgi:hypothetical protein